jgi:hypothetical protein
MSDDLPPIRELSDREILILIHSHVQSLAKTAEKHDGRINTLEKITWVASGASGVLGSALGLFLGWFLHR